MRICTSMHALTEEVGSEVVWFYNIKQQTIYKRLPESHWVLYSILWLWIEFISITNNHFTLHSLVLLIGVDWYPVSLTTNHHWAVPKYEPLFHLLENHDKLLGCLWPKLFIDIRWCLHVFANKNWSLDVFHIYICMDTPMISYDHLCYLSNHGTLRQHYLVGMT